MYELGSLILAAGGIGLIISKAKKYKSCKVLWITNIPVPNSSFMYKIELIKKHTISV